MKTAEQVLNDVLYHTRRTLRETNPEIEWEIIERGMIKCMEEYHQERMREELIKFIEWFRIEVCTEDVPIEDDYFADKYLNQKYE